MTWKKWVLWGGILAVAGTVTAVLIVRSHRWRPRTIAIQGAVIRKDADVHKELPIAGVEVIATDGLMTVRTQSDAIGYFNLKFRENVWPGQTVTLTVHKASLVTRHDWLKGRECNERDGNTSIAIERSLVIDVHDD